MILRLNIKIRLDYESSCQYYKMSVKLIKYPWYNASNQ